MAEQHHVLIIDEEAFVRQALKHYLESVAGDIRFSETGGIRDAIRIAAEDKVDLMVIESEMRGSCGHRGVTALSRQLPDIPKLMMCQKPGTRDVKKALAGGLSGIVPKTMAADTFIGVIRLMLSGATYFPPHTVEPGGQDKVVCEFSEPAPDGDDPLKGLTGRQQDVLALLMERATITDLVEQSQHHNQLVEILPDAILVICDGTIVFANPAAVDLYGAELSSQLVGRNNRDLSHPDVHGEIELREQELLTKNKSGLLEAKRRRLDGTEFMGESIGLQFMWDGEPAILVVIRDISEREQARKAIKESEQRFRDLIEGATLGMQISRPGGERLFVNRKFIEMFGFDSAEEALAVTEPGALVAPHDRDWMIGVREARARGGDAPNSLEYDALSKDGSIMPVQVFIRSLTWEGEAAIQITFIDITVRRRAQQAQRESEEHYRALAELSPEGILVDDGETIVFANPGLAKILGYASPDDLIGKNVIDLLAYDLRDEVMARRKIVDSGKLVEPAEGRYIRADGSETQVERVVSRITWEGKPSFLVLVRDINARKRAEKTLQDQRALLETVMNCMDPTLAAWSKDLKLLAWNRKWEEERKFPPGFLKPGIDIEQTFRWNFESGRFKIKDGENLEETIQQRLAYVRQGIEPQPIVERSDGTVIMRKRHPMPGGGFVTTRVDITELKQAQKASRESEERYRSLVEFVPEAVLVTDEGKILFANPAAVRLFGARDHDELIGISHLDLIHLDDQPRVKPRLAKEVASEPVTPMVELRSRRLDGSEIITECCSAPYLWHGSPTADMSSR